MSDDLAIAYEDLWYIKLISATDKNPLEKWGGYSQDYEDAENIYSHEQVIKSDHEYWGIVGIKDVKHTSRALLIFDLDVHKAPDDFDRDRVSVPDDTTVVRSQSGGYHVYFAVTNGERGGEKEADFPMLDNPGWDIDIRGSFVNHHVVAPNTIPGVGGKYELVNDTGIRGVVDPADAADRIQLDGEPLLAYDPAGGPRGGSINIDRNADPPEEMPTCYHRGLQARAANPDDPNINTHQVNTLTALCGLAAGYDIDTMVEHFCEDFAPGRNADTEETRYQLKTMARKMDRDAEALAPPAISTLREFGILDEGETCNCDIEYHGGDGTTKTLGDGDDVRRSDNGVEVPSDFGLKDGGYGEQIEKTDDKGDVYFVWNEWTNFEIELNSLIRTPDGDISMSLTVHPRHERAYDVDVEPTALNEPRSFKQEVCTGATTTYDGDSHNLAKIKQFVGAQEAPRKVGTDHMGYHQFDDQAVWVTPDGTIDADGWVDESDLVLVDKGITAERKWRLDPEQGDDYDAEKVREILELLPKARDPSRLLPLLGWFYAAATRPLILEWDDQFNFASVTGETGSGKTTTISTLWELFGMESEPLSPGTTEASLMTTFASSQSVPMWFDEYKPSDMSSQKVKTFHEKVRMATKGHLDQRSNVDLSDETYRLHAPTVVSGEERIQGSAEERRGIFTSFRRATTEPGTETALANARLTGTSTEDPDNPEKSVYFDGYDFDDHAIAFVRWICARDISMLETLWRDADTYVREFLGQSGVSGLDDLEVQGLQTVRYGCDLYNAFYRAMGGDGDVITDGMVNDAIDFVIAGAAGGENRRSHLDVMLDVASRAASDGYLEEDEQYTFVRKGTDSEELRINLAHAFDKVKRYAKDHDVSDDLLNNKSDYDERLRNEGENINWLTRRSQKSPPVGSAIGIDTGVAESEIEGFGRWMWDSEVDGSTGDEWNTMNTSKEGRLNLTFEVVSAATDTPNFLAESGVVADETKAMDYIVKASDRSNIPKFEEGDCYAAKGVKKGRYDGSPQLVFDAGVREIKEVEKGYGNIEAADAGMNTSLNSTAADGGEVIQLTKRVYDAIEEHEPVGSDFVKGVMASSGDAPGDVDDAIQRLANDGKIYGDADEWRIA